jgi:sugar phosphate isomerase/epimerase
VPTEKLRAVLDELVRANYSGVFTVEIFSEDDFLTSCAAIKAIVNSNISPGLACAEEG